MKYWFLLFFLLYEAGEDIKFRSISIYPLFIAGVAGIFWNVFTGEFSWNCVWWGVSMGMVLILVGILSKGAVGAGDGGIFMVTGIFLGGVMNMHLMIVSMMVGMAGAIFMKVNRKNVKEIPFIPCIFLAYLEVMVSAA